ncbi:MAG: hypothetical protein ABWX74_06810 [Aeromicrobium sp.]
MAHRTSRVAAIVLGGVVVASALTACGPERAELGAKTFSRSVIEGTTGTVKLPTGSLDLVVTEPRDELTDREAKPRRAPDGGSFVGLSWDFSPPARTATSAYVSRRRPQAAEVTLISDGKRYPIGEPYDAGNQVGDDTRSSSWWVAVAGDGEDLSVEVSFFGVRQLFDVATGKTLSGGAAPLYAPPPAVPVAPSCATEKPSGPFPRPEYDSFTCDIDVLGTEPFVDEVGWAHVGNTWAILSISTAVNGPIRWDDGTTEVEFDKIETFGWSAAVNDLPASVIVDNTHRDDDGIDNAVVAVEVPAGHPAYLVLRTWYRSKAAVPGSPDVPHPPTVGVSFTRDILLTPAP